MIEIQRHEHEDILQGFSFWAFPDPIIILVHEQGVWHSKTQYHGWGSFGAVNANVECTGFETMEQADEYIQANNLIHSGTHLFSGNNEITIFQSTGNAPVVISDGNIIQPQTASLLFGEPQKVIDWIMQEDFDLSGIITWDELSGAIKKDKLAVYNNILYICISAHNKQSEWTPDVSVSLWTRHLPDGVIGNWLQPQGAHDAYKLAMRVRHTGWIWEVTETDAAGNNVWEPGVFGWTKIQQLEIPEPPSDPCASIPEWSATEGYTNMAVGDLRKVEVNGVWKVYKVINLGQVHHDPAGPYGHYGWKWEYDCT